MIIADQGWCVARDVYIGDSKCAANVEMWHQVISILQSRDQIGPFLSLRCPRHENLLLKIAKPSDFEALAPKGGCARPCGQQLDCGTLASFSVMEKYVIELSPARNPVPKLILVDMSVQIDAQNLVGNV